MNDPCPYCGEEILFDIKDSKYGQKWMMAFCDACGYAVSIPLTQCQPTARREHYEKAVKIWELMGEIFSDENPYKGATK